MGPKSNQPRKLEAQEDTQSLNQWQSTFRSYYRSCERYGYFFRAGFVWDPRAENWGITAAETEGKKRPVEVLCQDLQDFLANLGSYLPYNYAAKKLLKVPTSLATVWETIYDIYDADITAASFMDFVHITKNEAESYRSYWERLVDHVRDHLAVSPPAPAAVIKVDEATAPRGNGEELTVTLLDLITVCWLQNINPRLVSIVQREYHTELKSGTRISQLVKRVAKQIDALLEKDDHQDRVQTVSSRSAGSYGGQSPEFPYETAPTQSGFDMESYVAVNRVRGGRGGRRPQRFRGGRGGRQNFYQRPQFFCSHCAFLSRTLETHIDTDHDPDRCSRKKVAVNIVNLSEENEGTIQSSESTQYQDHEEFGTPDPQVNKSQMSYLQEKDGLFKNEISEQRPPCPVVNPSFTSVRNIHRKVLSNSEDSLLSDPTAHVSRVISALCRLAPRVQSGKVLKSTSPKLKVHLSGRQLTAIIDTGAEISVLDLKTAKFHGVPVEHSSETAEAANHSPLKIAGQSAERVVLKVNTDRGRVDLDLGIVIVVAGLGCQCLVGQPALELNKINIETTTRSIMFLRNGTEARATYSITGSNSGYKLATISSTITLRSGEAIRYKLDENLANKDKVIITPRWETRSWLEPVTVSPSSGEILLKNSTGHDVLVGKDQHLADIRDCRQVDISDLENGASYKPSGSGSVNVVYQAKPDNFQYNPLVQHSDKPGDYLDQIQLDPDKRLTTDQREAFTEINSSFGHLFTPRPGKYNGFYGHVDNTLHFASPPAPNSRIHTPNYSPAMNQTLAEKMDKLEEWGVLQPPEKYNVSVEYISPSMVVPKQEKGEFRLVTDFSGLNSYLKKVPNTSPSINSAKSSIARANYHIHLDFSNYFYQNGMQRKDIQYLGTVHPFKGLRIYTVDPQGLKGASERSYEKIARVYGDMHQAGRTTSMADGLHVLGKDVEDLMANYIEVLTRADKAGFTFKPSKVVICPRRTQLFGWILDGHIWSPSAHVVSALSTASQPNTVKQLRSFIGAFKQLSSCIPGYAVTLSALDKYQGGKASAEKIVWTSELKKSFETAKSLAARPEGTVVPRPSDKLHTYSDYSEEHRAVGGRMVIHRTEADGSIKTFNGGYFSAVLEDHKKNWWPCEGEAAGIRHILSHFEPFIRESDHTTIHHTDSQPCVQAWNRARRGAYSSSSRISAFLTGLSSLNVELQYTPGKLMFTSDFASRNPPACKDKSCQVCKFVTAWEKIGDNASEIKTVTVADINEGRTLMLFAQPKTWLNIQNNDSVHSKLKYLIESQQLPETKKTGGNHTLVKRLHTAYTKRQLKIREDGLVMVKAPSGHYDGFVISIPHHLYGGVVQALHLSLNHPSKGQLTSLVSRYFYSPGWQKTVAEISDNCHQCSALRELPKVLLQDTSTLNTGFGTEASADVIERHHQKILVVREKLSQFTRAVIVKNQTAETMETALLQLVLDFMPDSGITIRTDGATAFQSLQRKSQLPGSNLHRLNIRVEVGRLQNKNKNPVAENANKELQKEMLRLNPSGGPITSTDLQIILRNINGRIRYHGLSSKEIFLRRELLSNKTTNINDERIAEAQIQRKSEEAVSHQKFLEKSHKKTPVQDLHAGQLVFIRGNRSKTQPRALHVVESLAEENGTKFVFIRKAVDKLRPRLYKMLPEELIPVPAPSYSGPDLDKDDILGEPHTEEQALDIDPPLRRSARLKEKTQSTVRNLSLRKRKRLEMMNRLHNKVGHSLTEIDSDSEDDNSETDHDPDEAEHLLQVDDEIINNVEEINDQEQNPPQEAQAPVDDVDDIPDIGDWSEEVDNDEQRTKETQPVPPLPPRKASTFTRELIRPAPLNRSSRSHSSSSSYQTVSGSSSNSSHSSSNLSVPTDQSNVQLDKVQDLSQVLLQVDHHIQHQTRTRDGSIPRRDYYRMAGNKSRPSK